MNNQVDQQKKYNQYDEPHADLRELLNRVERAGELLKVDNVDWNLEMGGLSEAVYHTKREEVPAILFDKVPGYQRLPGPGRLHNVVKTSGHDPGFPFQVVPWMW